MWLSIAGEHLEGMILLHPTAFKSPQMWDVWGLGVSAAAKDHSKAKGLIGTKPLNLGFISKFL